MRINWGAWMRLGIGELGLSPGDFWALTPGELMLIAGVSTTGGAMTRDRLADLARAFPDNKRTSDGGQADGS